MREQFSDNSADPSDKYSVFRALQQPETHRAANVVAEDSKDTFGAFKTGDHPVSKPDLIPNQFPLPHAGLGHPSNSNSSQTEVNVMGRLNNPNLQGNFGNFQAAAVQGTSQVTLNLFLNLNLNLNLNFITFNKRKIQNGRFPQIALASLGGKRQERIGLHYSLSNLNKV